jgi:hypothetical protein
VKKSFSEKNSASLRKAESTVKRGERRNKVEHRGKYRWIDLLEERADAFSHG